MRKLVIMGLVAAVAVAVQAETAFRLGDITQIVFEDAFVTNSAKSWGAAAARDLRNALGKVISRPIPYEREAKDRKLDGVTVYLGDTRAAKAEGLDAAKLKRGEFRLVTKPGKAFILSNTGMAATYGVAEFLERYADYYFCLISGDDPYTVQPEREVPVADVALMHDMYARHYSCWGKHYPKTCNKIAGEFTRRARCRSWTELEPQVLPSRLPGYSHSYYKYVPPEKYLKDHPEYYSLGEDGVRHSKANYASELCLSNPEVLDVVYNSMCAMIEEEKAKKGEEYPRVYDFSQMDNASYICMCDKCKEIIARYNKKPGGHREGGDAGLQLWFVNQLARKIAERYPEVIIRTFAYVSTEEPPKGIVPEKNVMIWLCDLYTTSCNMLPLTHPMNAERLRMLKEWMAISNHFEVWDYYLDGGAWPDVDAVAADIRLFHDLGLKRMYNETTYHNQPYYELKMFVTSELYFDPTKDLEKLVETWCRVYGKGARKMKVAIDYIRKVILENPPKDMHAWHDRVFAWTTPGILEKYAALLKDAYAEEEANNCRSRMAHALADVSRILMKTYKTKGDEANFKRTQEEYVKFAEESLKAMALFENELKKEAKSIRETVELANLEFKDLPEELKDVPKSEMIFADHHYVQWDRNHQDRLVGGGAEGTDAFAWKPLDEKPLPFNCSMLDEDLQTNHLHPFNPVADGQWHWYKIATDRLGRVGWVGLPYIGDNSVAFKVHQFYSECDGMEIDPNWYDMWVSAKFGGDVHDKEKTLVIDRLILRRVPRKRR